MGLQRTSSISQVKMLTSAQVRMARAALQWSIADLARRAGLTTKTVIRFENGSNATMETVAKIKAALEEGGVSWVPENGGPAGVRPPRLVAGTGRSRKNSSARQSEADQEPG